MECSNINKKAHLRVALGHIINRPSAQNHLYWSKWIYSRMNGKTGAPNENIVQNHLNIALLNVF